MMMARSIGGTTGRLDKFPEHSDMGVIFILTGLNIKK